MKKVSKFLSLSLVFLFVFALMPAMAEGLTLKDMAGREVTLKGSASRVVALTASDCEILYAIGAGDMLVGRGEYCDYPLEVLEVPSVQSGMQTNLEQIIALEPDAVVMAKMAQDETQAQALEKAGIAVIVSDAQSIEGVYTAIGMLGRLTGRDEAAKALITEMRGRLDKVKEQAAAKNEGKTVYIESSPLQWGLWTTGKGTFMHEIAEIAGLKNIFEELDGWKDVSQEQVILRNPDFIITSAMTFGEGPKPAEEIASRAGWEGLKAIVNDGIFHDSSYELTRPGPRLADAAEKLFAFVYK